MCVGPSPAGAVPRARRLRASYTSSWCERTPSTPTELPVAATPPGWEGAGSSRRTCPDATTASVSENSLLTNTRPDTATASCGCRWSGTRSRMVPSCTSIEATTPLRSRGASSGPDEPAKRRWRAGAGTATRRSRCPSGSSTAIATGERSATATVPVDGSTEMPSGRSPTWTTRPAGGADAGGATAGSPTRAPADPVPQAASRSRSRLDAAASRWAGLEAERKPVGGDVGAGQDQEHPARALQQPCARLTGGGQHGALEQRGGDRERGHHAGHAQAVEHELPRAPRRVMSCRRQAHDREEDGQRAAERGGRVRDAVGGVAAVAGRPSRAREPGGGAVTDRGVQRAAGQQVAARRGKPQADQQTDEGESPTQGGADAGEQQAGQAERQHERAAHGPRHGERARQACARPGRGLARAEVEAQVARQEGEAARVEKARPGDWSLA